MSNESAITNINFNGVIDFKLFKMPCNISDNCNRLKSIENTIKDLQNEGYEVSASFYTTSQRAEVIIKAVKYKKEFSM